MLYLSPTTEVDPALYNVVRSRRPLRPPCRSGAPIPPRRPSHRRRHPPSPTHRRPRHTSSWRAFRLGEVNPESASKHATRPSPASHHRPHRLHRRTRPAGVVVGPIVIHCQKRVLFNSFDAPNTRSNILGTNRRPHFPPLRRWRSKAKLVQSLRTLLNKRRTMKIFASNNLRPKGKKWLLYWSDLYPRGRR